MKTRTLASDTLLLATAAIWGFAFVAQRHGMRFMGPFYFNGLRFALGALALAPLVVLLRRRKGPAPRVSAIRRGALAGFVLFVASTFQQTGLVYTTAGKAGFVTGFYVVLVPILNRLRGHRTATGTWLGALLAICGLYFLCVTRSLALSWGDLLILASALFYAVHVLIVDRLADRGPFERIALTQYGLCALLSLAGGALYETITWEGVRGAALAIAYGGICSVGVAYTLQLVAQRKADPSHAAILLCLESVFGAFGGWLLLGEILSMRTAVGCGLMLVGMITSQVFARRRLSPEPLGG